jgi:hypothetical protein
VTVFVGLPFLIIGLVFLGLAILLLVSRYQRARRSAEILVNGQAALGRIVDLVQNYNVRINNKHPWNIKYTFRAYEVDFDGQLTTLKTPGSNIQPGSMIYVLYDIENPEENILYPPI